MTPFELADKIGGTYNANKVRVVMDGNTVLAGYFDGAQFTITDEGRRALNRAEAEVVEEKPQKSKRAKAAEPSAQGEPTVESGEAPAAE